MDIPLPKQGLFMPNNSLSSLESNFRLFFGFLLWAVSATLTLVLLISMGDGTISSKVLLGVVAIALEGSKILAWRKSGTYRIYAVALIILSGIASLGTSLQVVEKSKGSFLSISRDEVHSSPAYLAKEGELASIDSEIAALVSRLKALPPDYTTATVQTESSLTALRDRKQSILESLATEETVGASYDDRNMVAILGRTLGLRPEVLLLVLLLFVSASIEVGALLLTIPDHEAQETVGRIMEPPTESVTVGDTSFEASPLLSPSYAPPITPDDFLEAAKDGSDLPFLRGRDTTAEKLGISYAEAKRLVGKLIEDGRVVVEGKRLRLVPVKDPATPISSAQSSAI
jgi:hypothetical protein